MSVAAIGAMSSNPTRTSRIMRLAKKRSLYKIDQTAPRAERGLHDKPKLGRAIVLGRKPTPSAKKHFDVG